VAASPIRVLPEEERIARLRAYGVLDPDQSLPALDEGMAVAELSPEVLRRARTVYPLLRDENLDLVSRELERTRRRRFALPDPGEEAI